MKKPLIVANWKMNPSSLSQARILFNKVKNTGAIICPPFVYLAALKANGAQDVFGEPMAGAFTGEISALMLKNLGVQYVIVGHSERRKHQKETDEMIGKKIKAALQAGLKPILCIDKISQLKIVQLSNCPIDQLIVAYEPLFAIGTGKACRPEKAKKMRMAIEKIIGAGHAILYGGSVNAQNAKNYIYRAGFQGLLIGGVSLRPEELIDIIKNTCYSKG